MAPMVAVAPGAGTNTTFRSFGIWSSSGDCPTIALWATVGQRFYSRGPTATTKAVVRLSPILR